MGKKLTYDYVYNYFKEQGCKLLETEYINTHHKMRYRCICKNISEISFANFQKGRRCKKCAIERNKDSRKLTFEYVYSYFKDQGCELLETEYINAHHKMRYRCSCKNISEICFSDFQQGRRCKKCGYKKIGNNKKLSFEYVYNYFKDHGCELLETEYINNYTKMKYRCICGSIREITFANFQQGRRCKECGLKKSAEKQKLTFEYVYNYFKEQGCELLETEYINARHKMRYRCNCGNISKITFSDFKQGYRCRKCSGYEKFTFEYVYNYFKEQGCELLETEYINVNHKMKYKCNCGNISKICFTHFQQGQRCKKCGGTEKLTFEYVYNYFKEQGCELLETEYINTHHKMRYRCNCKNISEICFYNFQQGKRCKKCSGHEKLTFDYVYNYFKERGCELLEKKYVNYNTKMRYRCSCGNISEISFNNFSNGRRCKKCAIERTSGEKSVHYNPNLSDEYRVDRRLIPGYEKWVKDVYKKYDWTCQKCKIKKDSDGKYKKNHAHHIENYADNIDIIIDIDNGITFCSACHHDFHKKYGKRNNTREQLDEFLAEGVLNDDKLVVNK